MKKNSKKKPIGSKKAEHDYAIDSDSELER